MSIIYVANYGDGTAAQVNFNSAYAAASDGDTIIFPLNGSASWSSESVISKAITINGNGTTLTAAVTPLTKGFFHVTNIISNALLRITGFTFNVLNFSSENRSILVKGSGSGGSGLRLTSLRIDHNIFYYGYEAMTIECCFGVIDHNTYYNVLKALGFSAGTVDLANESWDDMSAGTANALFFETNNIIYNSSYPGAYHQESIATENGGKLVIRYNNWDSVSEPDGLDTMLPIMTHGSAAGGVPDGYWSLNYGTINQGRRGQSVVEVYNNAASGKRIDFFFVARGSANLVYNNYCYSATAYTNTPSILLREEENFEYGLTLGATQWNTGAAYTAGAVVYQTGMGISTGFNRYYQARYAISGLDQPPSTGWYTVQFNPPRTNSAWPAEDQVHNSFFWNNNLTGAIGYVNYTGYVFIASESTGYIQQNRDYWMHAPEASGGFEYFSGLNGASNTFPTDGKVYPTSGTMLFSPTGANAYYGYVPYTYPHPLTGPFYSLKRWGNNLRFVGLAV